MRTFEFYGHGDDVFQCGPIDSQSGIEGQLIEEDVYGFSVACGDNLGLALIANYAGVGVNGPIWTIGIAQLDEGIPIPEWNIRLDTAKNGSSPRITMDIPEGAVIKGAEDWVVESN